MVHATRSNVFNVADWWHGLVPQGFELPHPILDPSSANCTWPMIHLLHVESGLCISKDPDSKPRLDAARSGCLQIWMPFGQVQISRHGLTSNGDVQLIHTIESRGPYPDIRNYRRGCLQFGADDQSRVLFRSICSTLQRIAREGFPLPQFYTAAPLFRTMHSSSSIVPPSLPSRQYILQYIWIVLHQRARYSDGDFVTDHHDTFVLRLSLKLRQRYVRSFHHQLPADPCFDRSLIRSSRAVSRCRQCS